MRRAPLAVVLAALAVVAGGCGGGKSAATTTVTTVSVVTTSVTTHGRFHYPPALVENFMRSCTKDDPAKQAYCGCTLDKLSNNVSTQDFARIGRSGAKVPPPRIRRLIRQAAAACVH